MTLVADLDELAILLARVRELEAENERLRQDLAAKKQTGFALLSPERRRELAARGGSKSAGKPRFTTMPPEKHRELSVKGGKASQASGKCHEHWRKDGFEALEQKCAYCHDRRTKRRDPEGRPCCKDCDER